MHSSEIVVKNINILVTACSKIENQSWPVIFIVDLEITLISNMILGKVLLYNKFWNLYVHVNLNCNLVNEMWTWGDTHTQMHLNTIRGDSVADVT